MVNDDKQFKICLGVEHFKPEEINIKTVANRVVIKGKHEEKQDEHGYIMREFTRQYVLPKVSIRWSISHERNIKVLT